jgi:hypothetical protein
MSIPRADIARSWWRNCALGITTSILNSNINPLPPFLPMPTEVTANSYTQIRTSAVLFRIHKSRSIDVSNDEIRLSRVVAKDQISHVSPKIKEPFSSTIDSIRDWRRARSIESTIPFRFRFYNRMFVRQNILYMWDDVVCSQYGEAKAKSKEDN